MIHKGEEDVDIGDEMPMNDYPPLEIERDVSSPAHSERSRNTGNSSSDSDSSSSSGKDFSRFCIQIDL